MNINIILETLAHSSPFGYSSSVAIDWKSVGRRIRELRGFNTNQADFARRIGVKPGLPVDD